MVIRRCFILEGIWGREALRLTVLMRLVRHTSAHTYQNAVLVLIVSVPYCSKLGFGRRHACVFAAQNACKSLFSGSGRVAHVDREAQGYSERSSEKRVCGGRGGGGADGEAGKWEHIGFVRVYWHIKLCPGFTRSIRLLLNVPLPGAIPITSSADLKPWL